jgi:hypothetical protein
VDACNPPTASAPDLGAGQTRRPRDFHLSHARLRPPRLSPLRARPRARPIWAGARSTLTRRLRDPPVSKRRQLGYYSNTKAYIVFNKSSGLVEVSSDVVFDETNCSPREQVDLDDIDEDDVLTAAMHTMAIGDVRPQEQQEKDQPSSSTMVHPPTQDDGQVPQEEVRDQGGAQEEQVMEEEAPRVPPTQV